MNKLSGAFLLVVLGLAAGLWLGFDPQARAMVQENATKASETIAKVGADVSMQVDAIASPDSSSRTQEKQQPAGSPNINLNLSFQSILDGARQMWLSFISKFRLKT